MIRKFAKRGKEQAEDEPNGWLSNFLAEEDDLDRRALWRLGSWGVGTVGAVIVGVLAAQSPIALQRDQLAAAETQAQQLQWIAKDSQDKARQLASAVETLNSDRDRLYARVTVLEENLESVTGSVARQKAAASLPVIPPASQVAVAPAAPSEKSETVAATTPPESKPQAATMTPPPKIAPVASIPSPQPESKAESKTASAQSDKKETPVTGALQDAAGTPSEKDSPKPVQKTAFGVELGGANSVEGLRAIWRALNKSNGSIFGGLQPIVVLKEGNDGLGMKLRLVAGPLNDAAAAAKICAILIADKRACAPSVYDGQRLAMQDEKKPDAKSAAKKHAQTSAPPASGASPFSSLFGFR
ncbi:MAG: hypothetical protein HY242_16720 [Afipia sp.]|nr:hypothetical protein [Afipia sp.]